MPRSKKWVGCAKLLKSLLAYIPAMRSKQTNRKKEFFYAFVLSCCFAALLHGSALAQNIQRSAFWTPDSVANPNRLRLVGFGSAGAMVGVFTYLGTSWYSDDSKTKFRWFDDGNEWQQIDKVGHAYGAYQESRLMMQMLKWAGAKRKHVLLWGGLTGIILQSPIEYFDGRSSDYGASGWDLFANGVGSGLAITNEALWREQRLQLKFAYSPTDFPKQRPDLLGDGIDELLKDYNGQTYWLCLSVDPFLPEGKIKQAWPDWLGLAVGYGGEGMIGGYATEPSAMIDAREYRQWYLSLDIDLTRIKTRSGFLRAVFYTLNAVRVPLPALEFGNGKTLFRPLSF